MLALLAAVVTALAVYSYLSSLRAQIPVTGRMVPMVVASTDIDSGVVITAGMVEMADHPERYLPEQALMDARLAIGRWRLSPSWTGNR